MSKHDSTQRFLFQNFNVRGELAQLEDAYREVLQQRHYPPEIQILLGQFMAASVLLSSTIKFDGSLILQVKTEGRLQLLMAECRNRTRLRAIARLSDTDDGPIIKDGQLAITIEPRKGKTYQGIVAMEEDGLARSLEVYFKRSEQLDTRIWLTADSSRAGGMLLQALPQATDKPDLPAPADDWNRIVMLASTLSDNELTELETEHILTRLFHEEQVRVFGASPLTFYCGCSAKRSGSAIKFLGFEEAMALASERGTIEIGCQFCHKQYCFSADDVEAIFKKESPPEGTVLH